MNQSSTQIGRLNCQVVDFADGEPELVVVLCHGFGAPGTDLVSLGQYIVQLDPQLNGRVRFVFPAAPLSLDDQGIPGGRAWWPLDMVKLQMAMATGEFRDLRNDHPEELPAAREKLLALIDEVRGRTGLPMSKIVLGGFSQGSMLSSDIALRLDDPPAALCVWSGTLLCEDTWRGLAAKRGPLRVLQSHGRTDPILPFEASLWLRDLFRDSGFEIEFIEFNGTHTIPYEAMASFVQMLESICDSPGP